MLHSRLNKILSWSVLGLIIFSVTGCQSARLTHFDKRDFEPIFEVELPESAYIAVDSCATGIHAIVALELGSNSGFLDESERMSLSATEALPLTLTYGDTKPVRANFARLEGPTCLPVSELYGARQLPILADPTTACIYVYHAEFELSSVPKKEHEMVLHYGGQQVTLAVKK